MRLIIVSVYSRLKKFSTLAQVHQVVAAAVSHVEFHHTMELVVLTVEYDQNLGREENNMNIKLCVHSPKS